MGAPVTHPEHKLPSHYHVADAPDFRKLLWDMANSHATTEHALREALTLAKWLAEALAAREAGDADTFEKKLDHAGYYAGSFVEQYTGWIEGVEREDS